MKQPEKETQPEKEKPAQTEQPAGIVQPMIDELRRPKETPPLPQAPPRGPVHPPQPAEQDQDPGGGYNSDHTIPQP